MRKRSLLVTASLAIPMLMVRRHAAAAQRGVLRIGYQKASVTLVLARNRGVFEQKLNPLGYDVDWAEFTSGPPLLEALNAGAVNFGFTGEPPMIFAQAAGAPIVYVAATNPSPRAVAILKPAGSQLQSVHDLAGKKVAVAKGSSAHYLLVAALAKLPACPISTSQKSFCSRPMRVRRSAAAMSMPGRSGIRIMPGRRRRARRCSPMAPA